MKIPSSYIRKIWILGLITLLLSYANNFAQITIFTTQIPEIVGTDGDYELGTKFVSTHKTIIKTIRFYKVDSETGIHIGKIWSSSGTLLTSVEFKNETASGWQSATLATPLVIEGNTTYVVSVNINTAYSSTHDALTTSVTNGILTTVADGNNGVYNFTPAYFPTESYLNSNYFVDVNVVNTAVQPAPPTLISPANNATSVSIEPTVVWNEVEGATSYDLIVSDKSDFSTTIFEKTGITTNYYSFVGLTNAKAYYWKVKANQFNTYSSNYSVAFKFTTFAKVTVNLSYPIGGTQIYIPNPTLTWWLPTGGIGMKYDLIYSTDQSFTSNIVKENLTTNIYTLSGLNSGVLYYWKIRLKNSSNQVISYSDVENFKTYGTPVVPVISWPTGNNTVYTLKSNLYWYLNAPSFGLKYEIQLKEGDTTALNSTDVTYSDIFGSPFEVTLLQGKTYSWKVRSLQGTTPSAWSKAATFKTIAIPSVIKPIASYPTNNATVYSVKPTLYWYLGAYITGLKYEIEYVEGVNTNFPASPAPQFTNVTSLYVTLSNELIPGNTYKWRVRSTDGTNYSDWSDVAKFVVSATLAPTPVTPIASYPVDNAKVYTAETTLYWYIGTLGLGLTYDVELKQGTNVTEYKDLEWTFVKVENLQPATVYQWRVRSKVGTNTSSWSAWETFSTVSNSPVAVVPVVSWPKGGATVYTNSQLLSWYVNSVGLGLKYDLRYSNNADMSDSIVIKNLTTTGYTLNGLIAGTPYYWQVRSYDGVVYSNYSVVADFVTAANNQPVMPIAGSPIEGVQLTTNTPVLSWFIPTNGNIESYEVQYSNNAGMNDATIITSNSTNAVLNNLSNNTYYWRVRSKTADGNYSSYSSIAKFIANDITDVENENSLPNEFTMSQNYPNPFNPTTTIEFSIPTNGIYTLEVFNILGQKVATLLNGNLEQGNHKAIFNATNLSTGIYLYRLSGNSVTITKKMMILK